MVKGYGKGWHFEYKRHSIAAKGVKSKIGSCPKCRVKMQYEEPVEIILSDDRHYPEGDYYYCPKCRWEAPRSAHRRIKK